MFHGGDVVLADVQKDGAGQVHANDPAILQRLAGDFHGEEIGLDTGGVEEVLLQVQGLRGGELGGAALHTVVGDNGGQQGAGLFFLGGQEVVQDGFDIIGGCGFALGAGDAGDAQLPRGVAVGEIGQSALGLPDVADLQAGEGDFWIRGFADIGERALLHGGL